MNDYIVLVDEKGQPYIAHRRGQLITNLREGSKSVAKLVDGAKTRYFKTQEELKAYLNEGKKKAYRATDKAKKKASQVVDKAKKKASQAVNKAKEKIYNAKETVRAHASDKLSDIKDWVSDSSDSTKEKFSDAKEIIKAYASDKLSDIKDWVSDRADSAKEKVGRSVNKFNEMTKGVFDTVSSLADDPNYRDIIKKAILTGVLKKTVEKHERELSESEIIDRVSGGDKTKGSCSSLAIAYIANKMGYDVLDFRGGSSTDLFSNVNIVSDMVRMASKISPGSAHQSNFPSAKDSAKQTLEWVEEGKEYYYVAGCHAAMVKKEDGNLYYLELQSPVSTNNGWQVLDDTALTWRFACYYVNYRNGMPSYIIDSEVFANDKFVNLFSYINTDEKRQNKGGGGSVK